MRIVPDATALAPYLGKSLDQCSLSRLLRLGLGHLGLGRCVLSRRSLDGLDLGRLSSSHLARISHGPRLYGAS
ncbi:unnamed protein product [Spirodela intermedia]|uniref:Uncharacterized protein n=1 Tax=Spirodela intermedia TaxID=51605 RepID=A0A7I8LGS4_SPIIN|nr:unnamed protein product [Spirodela intermedia]